MRFGFVLCEQLKPQGIEVTDGCCFQRSHPLRSPIGPVTVGKQEDKTRQKKPCKSKLITITYLMYDRTERSSFEGIVLKGIYLPCHLNVIKVNSFVSG